MEQTAVYRVTRYRKGFLRGAVCDMLRIAGCSDYTESRDGPAETVMADAEALGNKSGFQFQVEDWGLGSRLTVAVVRPCPGLSRLGEKRAADNMADRTLQLLEDTLRADGHGPPRIEAAEPTGRRRFLAGLFSVGRERRAMM